MPLAKYSECLGNRVDVKIIKTYGNLTLKSRTNNE
jgi:hypothetical protein